jgi:hypothetical protein
MTLREYAEQMGMRVVCEIATDGFRCSLAGLRIADSCGHPSVCAEGENLEEAHAALAAFISGRILQDSVRATALYWVPNLTE